MTDDVPRCPKCGFTRCANFTPGSQLECKPVPPPTPGRFEPCPDGCNVAQMHAEGWKRCAHSRLITRLSDD